MRTAKQDEFYRSKSFDRQVRRHLKAGVQRFAVVVPPAFAPLCRAELTDLGLAPAAEANGIIEFDGKWEDAYRANLWLRTASRVLWRRPDFRSRAVEDLFEQSAKQRWELWLDPRIPIRLAVHLAESRIGHEGQAAEALVAGISKRMAQFRLPRPRDCSPPVAAAVAAVDPVAVGDAAAAAAADYGADAGPEPNQLIIARIQRNRCQLSIDTSGFHLHRRGYRLVHTGAPMRETLAAAVLLKAGWNGSTPLVDAMSGSGTVAIEAARLARNIAPGLDRRFLFESWPCAFADTFRHVKTKAAEAALNRSPVPIVAVERDPGAIATARENARKARVDPDIRWHTGDFFDFTPVDRDLTPGLIVVDPPYGKRLASEGKTFYQRLGVVLRERFRGWRAAVFTPERLWLSQLGCRPLRTWSVPHGGLAIEVALFRIG